MDFTRVFTRARAYNIKHWSSQSLSRLDLIGVVDVVAAEDERDVVAGVGFSRRVDADDWSGLHEHHPVFPEQNFVPGLEDERAVAQRLEVVAGEIHLEREILTFKLEQKSFDSSEWGSDEGGNAMKLLFLWS